MGGRQAPSGQTKNEVRAHNSQKQIEAFADPVCVGHTHPAPRADKGCSAWCQEDTPSVLRHGGSFLAEAVRSAGRHMPGKKGSHWLTCQVSSLRFMSLWLAIHQRQEKVRCLVSTCNRRSTLVRSRASVRFRDRTCKATAPPTAAPPTPCPREPS